MSHSDIFQLFDGRTQLRETLVKNGIRTPKYKQQSMQCGRHSGSLSD